MQPAVTPAEQEHVLNLTNDEDSLQNSQWTALLLQKHPKLLALRERAASLRSESFGRLANGASTTEVQNTLSPHVVLQLVLQYLKEENYLATARELEREAAIACTEHPEPYLHTIDEETDLPQGILTDLLRMGITDIEHIFELHKEKSNEGDAEVEAFEEFHTYFLDEGASMHQIRTKFK